MPKDTFVNLSPEKQKKIFSAAIQEFSQRRFSEASINQIIKNAQISRGSFYQYFSDKEDLYLYMLTEIGKEKLANLGVDDALDADAGFFASYIKMLEQGLVWAQKNPAYTRVGMLMELDDSHFIQKLRSMAVGGLDVMRELITRDQQGGRIRSDVDPDLVIDMLYTLNISFFKDYLDNGRFDIQGIVKKASEILRIMQDGIAVRDNNNHN
jgi:TetR/AcrR family transcriptional regulator